MRYKVRAASEAAYDRILGELEDHDVAVTIRSRRRRMVATGDLSDEVRRRIGELGAEVVRDDRYDVEQPD